ncbi:MAG: hypothetical protein WA874_22245 [Chryseosolibacter sp.]
MPIQVRRKKLNPWHNDLADEIKVDMLNQVVCDFTSEAKNELEKMECPKHPNTLSYVTIIPDRMNVMIIRKKFCCPEFEEKISVKLER